MRKVDKNLPLMYQNETNGIRFYTAVNTVGNQKILLLITYMICLVWNPAGTQCKEKVTLFMNQNKTDSIRFYTTVNIKDYQ